jgi:hypothetical protein
MFSINKKVFLIIAILVVLFAAVGIWVGVALTRFEADGPSPYSAVFLATGDVYFGKLSWFPWPRLDEAWLLQRAAGPNGEPQFSLAPLNSAFWGPAGTVYLNREQIVFWTRLTNSSRVAQAFQNPGAFQTPQPVPPQTQAEPPPPPLPQGEEGELPSPP